MHTPGRKNSGTYVHMHDIKVPYLGISAQSYVLLLGLDSTPVVVAHGYVQ